MDAPESFVDALPEVELHVHLVGSGRPDHLGRWDC
jgi:adenosine deaminase